MQHYAFSEETFYCHIPTICRAICPSHKFALCYRLSCMLIESTHLISASSLFLQFFLDAVSLRLSIFRHQSFQLSLSILGSLLFICYLCWSYEIMIRESGTSPHHSRQSQKRYEVIREKLFTFRQKRHSNHLQTITQCHSSSNDEKQAGIQNCCLFLFIWYYSLFSSEYIQGCQQTAHRHDEMVRCEGSKHDVCK